MTRSDVLVCGIITLLALAAIALGVYGEDYIETREVAIAPMPAVVCPNVDDAAAIERQQGWRWHVKYRLYQKTLGCNLYLAGKVTNVD